ncbi:unnamed protein product [Rhizoctonia solani]|uniref:Uncharacterized protein n=3 Tax=Rhizoctonia solani TaxID=456999 RepID=A0A8H3HTE2_9AGAM
MRGGNDTVSSGRISYENVKVSDRDGEQELAHRKSVSSLVPRQGGECVSPTSASDDGDNSPSTKDNLDFKSSPPQKDQVKASSTSCRPQEPQPSKDQPTTSKQDREPTANLVESGSDDITAAQPGADSLLESSDHPTPSATPSALPHAEDDEQTDTLDSLVNELGRITLQGTPNSASDIKPKLEQEKPVQPPSLRIGYEGQVKIEEPEDCDVGGSVPSTIYLTGGSVPQLPRDT